MKQHNEALEKWKIQQNWQVKTQMHDQTQGYHDTIA